MQEEEVSKSFVQRPNPWGEKRDKISLQTNCKSSSPLLRSFQGESEEANHVMKEFGTWWSLPNVQGLMILLYPL